MLSPAELLGLSGATLENRVRRAVHHVSDAALSRIEERLRADAAANEVVYERDGQAEPVRIMPRPLLAMPEQLNYVDHVCLKLAEALKQLPALYLEHADVREILAITPDEQAWLSDLWSPYHQRLNPIYGRLDAVCDFTAAGWQDSLQFMEPNLSGVGGIHFAPLAEQLVMRDVIPSLLALDPGLAITLPRDQRDLFVQVLIDHSRAIGRNSCQLCFVEPKYVHEGPNEQLFLGRFLAERHGLTIEHADPRELRVQGDEIYYGDVQVDVAYRDYEIRDLIALEREMGKPLDAMRTLFRQNRVVSSFVGDFDHKSCWELLTDESLSQRFFNEEQRRLFRRHVLWTRLVRPCRTSLPHGGQGELLEFVRQHRDQLVLKPNRSYGGVGVTLGAATDQRQWEQLLDSAVHVAADPQHSWVVQWATRLPVVNFPVIGSDGRVFEEPYHAVMGFVPTENGLGVVCRVSQKQVVNVAQYGGLAALLIAHPPQELRLLKRTSAHAERSERLLRDSIAELRHLDQTIGVLSWDEETMLPVAGRPQRGEQLATLEGLRHAHLVSDRLGDLIEDVAQLRAGDERWDRELVLLRRLRRMAQGLSDDLVRTFARAKSRALGAWEEARTRQDFQVFGPALKSVLELTREKATSMSQGGDPYDALLEEHEPGMTQKQLEPVLNELRDRLVPLVQQWSGEQASQVDTFRGRRFADARQWELCGRILEEIGFDLTRGRLDRSSHPFTMLAGDHDVRLTTRVEESDLVAAVLATLHEGGHGLYDQGFLSEDRDWLVADAPSMGLHESQARLWENHAGRSAAFWDYWFPTLRSLFPDAMAGLDPHRIYRSVNLVRPGCNRVLADEASYHLHIILRYELELALIKGDLSVADLPQSWMDRCEALIGVRPTDDCQGVLQDVHWSLGMFGYFPSYTVGTLYAAQLIETYGQEHCLQSEIRDGAFAPLLAWLRRHVHQVGHRLPAERLIRQVTGRGLDNGALLRHLTARYQDGGMTS